MTYLSTAFAGYGFNGRSEPIFAPFYLKCVLESNTFISNVDHKTLLCTTCHINIGIERDFFKKQKVQRAEAVGCTV